MIPRQKPRPWHAFFRALASSRLGAAVLSQVLFRLDRLFLTVSAGRTTAASVFAGLPVVTLVTTGARSGKNRSNPLIAVMDGERIILVASNWAREHYPGWYYNLLAYPNAEIVYDQKSASYVAHEATGEEWEAAWKKASSLYLGYGAYRTRMAGRHIPLMILEPAPR